MSWCVMQDKVYALAADMEVVYRRTGGRFVDGTEPEPFVTVPDLQVAYSLLDMTIKSPRWLRR